VNKLPQVFWKQVMAEQPVMKILFTFIIGILLRWHCDFDTSFSIISICLLIILVVSIYIIHTRLSPIWSKLSFLFIVLLTIVLGFAITDTEILNNKKTHFKNFKGTLLAHVISNPKDRGNSQQVTIAVRQRGNHNTIGRLNAFFAKSDTIEQIQYGDIVLIKDQNLKEVESPKNPHQFHYKNYLKAKGIYHQQYIKPAHFMIIDNKQNPIVSLAFRLNLYFRNVIDHYVLGVNERAVAKGIILGYDDDISELTRNQYALSGALHILSVSGMHIGIIVIMLSYVLFFLEKSRKGRLLKFGVIAIFLMLYVLVSGASASVVRAALMFGMLQIGRLFFPSGNMRNIVLGSALLLLLYNPFYLFDIGFQLSYLALVGIIYLYPYFKKIYMPDNKYVGIMYQWILISLAAQITTLPLSLFYFHQFSIISVIANLFVIPISTGILYGGMILFVVHKIPLIAEGIGIILHALIRAMDAQIGEVITLPGAFIGNITINELQMFLLYAMLLFIILYFHLRVKNFIFYTIYILLLFITIESVDDYTQLRKQSVIVYSLSQGVCIDFYQQDTLWYYQYNTMPHEIRNKVEPYRLYNNIKARIDLSETNNSKIMKYNRNFLFADMHYSIMSKGISNYNIITNEMERNNSEKYWKHADTIIIGNDVYAYQKLQLNKMQNKFDLKTQGAFIRKY